MALPDSAKLIVGVDIVVADTTYAPSANNLLGTRTDQIDCTSLQPQQARQSDKLDFGPNWDLQFVLRSAVEWANSPEVAAGEIVNFYMSWSNNAVPAVANSGGVSGVDSAYIGLPGGTLDASLKMLHLLGPHNMDNVISSDATQIDMDVATFSPRARYGTLVVYNKAISAPFNGAMLETAFVLSPLVLQIQD